MGMTQAQPWAWNDTGPTMHTASVFVTPNPPSWPLAGEEQEGEEVEGEHAVGSKRASQGDRLLKCVGANSSPECTSGGQGHCCASPAAHALRACMWTADCNVRGVPLYCSNIPLPQHAPPACLLTQLPCDLALLLCMQAGRTGT